MNEETAVKEQSFDFGVHHQMGLRTPPDGTGRSQLPFPLDRESEEALRKSLKTLNPELNRVQAITLLTGQTTFAVRNSNSMSVSGAAAVTLAKITNGYTGQLLVLLFQDANVTITDDATGLPGTVNLKTAFTGAAGDALLLACTATNSWVEVARSPIIPTVKTGTIVDNADVATAVGGGTNTDTVVSHGLGRVPAQITIAARVTGTGSTNSKVAAGSATYDAAAALVNVFAIRYNNVGSPSFSGGDLELITNTDIGATGVGGAHEAITITILSVTATQFTFRINGILTGADPGASTVANITWKVEG